MNQVVIMDEKKKARKGSGTSRSNSLIGHIAANPPRKTPKYQRRRRL
jgi:hypothetical protein